MVATLPGNRLGCAAKDGRVQQVCAEATPAFIVKRINQTPQRTLHQLKDELAACGVKVSHDSVWWFLPRERLRFKNFKKHCSL